MVNQPFARWTVILLVTVLSFVGASQSHAQTDDPENPCSDDCTEHEWSEDWITVPVQLAGCGGCWVNVTYKTRDMCGNTSERLACEVYFGSVDELGACACPPGYDFLNDVWTQFLRQKGSTLPCAPNATSGSTNVLRLTVGACWKRNEGLTTPWGRWRKCSGSRCCSRDYGWDNINSYPQPLGPTTPDFDCEPFAGCIPACGSLPTPPHPDATKPAVVHEVLATTISIVPNPARDRVTATWDIAPVGRISVKVVSVDGRVTISERSHKDPGEAWHLDMSIGGLSAGQYFMQLEGENGVVAAKSFIIQE